MFTMKQLGLIKFIEKSENLKKMIDVFFPYKLLEIV